MVFSDGEFESADCCWQALAGNQCENKDNKRFSVNMQHLAGKPFPDMRIISRMSIILPAPNVLICVHGFLIWRCVSVAARTQNMNGISSSKTEDYLSTSKTVKHLQYTHDKHTKQVCVFCLSILITLFSESYCFIWLLTVINVTFCILWLFNKAEIHGA